MTKKECKKEREELQEWKKISEKNRRLIISAISTIEGSYKMSQTMTTVLQLKVTALKDILNDFEFKKGELL